MKPLLAVSGVPLEHRHPHRMVSSFWDKTSRMTMETMGKLAPLTNGAACHGERFKGCGTCTIKITRRLMPRHARLMTFK